MRSGTAKTSLPIWDPILNPLWGKHTERGRSTYGTWTLTDGMLGGKKRWKCGIYYGRAGKEEGGRVQIHILIVLEASFVDYEEAGSYTRGKRPEVELL